MSSITTVRLLYTTLLLVTLSGGYTTAAQSNPQVDGFLKSQGMIIMEETR